MLDASDMCALCSHETSAWLDKFTRGESVEGHEHHIVAGLFILAFGLMLGAGILMIWVGASRMAMPL